MDDGFFRHPKWLNKDAGRREKKEKTFPVKTGKDVDGGGEDG